MTEPPHEVEPSAQGQAPRVLVFNGSASVEGDTKVAILVSRALRTVADVTVLTMAGEASAEFAAHGLRVKTLMRPTLFPGRIGQVIRCTEFALLALFHCVFDRPKLIYTYDRTCAADVAIVVARLFRIPFIFHVNHGEMCRINRRRFMSAQRAAMIWSVSKHVLRQANDVGPRATHTLLFNCVEDTEPVMGKTEARLSLGLPVDGLIAVIAGRLSPFKGQETFVRALAHERLENLGVHGYVVGNDTGEGAYDLPPHPDYQSYLVELAASLELGGRMHFVGRQRSLPWLAAADVVCFLSDAEPFGLVVPEAAAQGSPIVATSSGAVPELLRDGASGLLVPPRDASACAQAIRPGAQRPNARNASRRGCTL